MFAAFSVARLRLAHGERDLRSTIRDNLQYLFNETLSSVPSNNRVAFSLPRELNLQTKRGLMGNERKQKKVRQWKTKHPSSEYSNWIGAFYDCCQSCRAFEHLLLDVSGWEHPPERAFRVESYAAMSETLTNKLIDFSITSWRIYEALTQPTLRQTFHDTSSTTGRSYFMPDFASLLPRPHLRREQWKSIRCRSEGGRKKSEKQIDCPIPFFLSRVICAG